MIRHLHSWLNFPEILCMFKEFFCEDIPIVEFWIQKLDFKRRVDAANFANLHEVRMLITFACFCCKEQS